MSHTVTITKITTTNSGTALFLNIGYLKTIPGLLKLAQLVLGAVCVGIIAHYMDIDGWTYRFHDVRPEMSLLLAATSFLTGTFCLLAACLFFLSSASNISKSLYEMIYHGLAFILYLAAGLTVIIVINKEKDTYERHGIYEPYLAASVIGLVLAVLYLFSTILAYRTYRGI